MNEFDMTFVKQYVENRVSFIEMQNDAKLNCLSRELCEQIIEAINSTRDEDVFAIVLRAREGVRVWSAGHNVSELPKRERDPLSYSTYMEHLLREIQNAPVPVIALVEGSVWGGACDVCTVCDMIIADEGSTFAITPAKLGIPYNPSGLLHFIDTMSLNKAKEMFFTASPITAQDAYNMGWVNYVAKKGELKKTLDEKLLDKMRKNSVLAISVMKRQFSAFSRAGTNISPEIFEMMQAWRRKVYDSHDYQEGVHSFLEKRSPVFNGKACDVDLHLTKRNNNHNEKK